ncbi:hypothetical protein EG833_04425 [archaeon]|nr:hypothetical protein [archaeon]
MYRIRSLILLLICASAASCSYSFVLDGKLSTEKFTLKASTNGSTLIDGGSVLDANMETTLSSMGMLAAGSSRHNLHCTLISSTNQALTTTSLSSSNDRYRLQITVSVVVTDMQGKEVWKMTFTDTGTYNEGGRAEDALDETCRRISHQIARALVSLSL